MVRYLFYQVFTPIIHLLKDPLQIKLMGEKGYERFIKHFTVSKMIHNYEALYEKCLKD